MWLRCEFRAPARHFAVSSHDPDAQNIACMLHFVVTRAVTDSLRNQESLDGADPDDGLVTVSGSLSCLAGVFSPFDESLKFLSCLGRR